MLMVKGDESGCCRMISANKLDRQVWDKVWRVISDDDFFESRVRDKIESLQREEADAEEEVSRLEAALDDIAMRRQTVMRTAIASTCGAGPTSSMLSQPLPRWLLSDSRCGARL